MSNSPDKIDVMETTDAHLVRSKNKRYGLDLHNKEFTNIATLLFVCATLLFVCATLLFVCVTKVLQLVYHVMKHHLKHLGNLSTYRKGP